MIASCNGFETVVGLLLYYRANVYLKSKKCYDYQTALHDGANICHCPIDDKYCLYSELNEQCCKVASRYSCCGHQTAFENVANHDHEKFVRMLRSHYRSNVYLKSTKCCGYQTALQKAGVSGHYKIVHMLRLHSKLNKQLCKVASRYSYPFNRKKMCMVNV